MCPLFIRMVIAIQMMLICSLFIRINMLRTHLKLNFLFGTNTNECKGRCVLVYLQEGKNHENQLLQSAHKTAKSSLSKVF